MCRVNALIDDAFRRLEAFEVERLSPEQCLVADLFEPEAPPGVVAHWEWFKRAGFPEIMCEVCVATLRMALSPEGWPSATTAERWGAAAAMRELRLGYEQSIQQVRQAAPRLPEATVRVFEAAIEEPPTEALLSD